MVPHPVLSFSWVRSARFHLARASWEGGDIPYKPVALAKRKENLANRWTHDPEVKCYMGGIPRSNYMPAAVPDRPERDVRFLWTYQFASSNRVINMGKKQVEAAVDTWMGTANGHWEGDTLVVDNTGFNDQSWFDRSGDFHSDQLHVVERFTLADADHMTYEATIEDPQVFTRPWKIGLTLYRHVEKNAQVNSIQVRPIRQELLYGDVRKKNEVSELKEIPR